MQLLEACVSFHLKDNVCDRTLQFLCTDSEGSNTKTSAELRSHQVLEMLLYKVTVCVQSGRFKTALNFLQVCLEDIYLMCFHVHLTFVSLSVCSVFISLIDIF